jgi:diguanylate cyclase (GGDEF)-like protein
MVGRLANGTTIRPRLLVVEPDDAVARRLVRALATAELASGRRDPEPAGAPLECRVVDSLGALHDAELSTIDLVICAASLPPDGSGLDALAYLRGAHPDVPVILLGEPMDAAMATEAIRAGAMDFVVLDAAGLRTLPLAVAKCLEHQRIKYENERLHGELSRSLADLELKNRQFESMIHRLERLTRTDELTGLANRRWLTQKVGSAWAEVTRHGHPIAFMMIDLDDFKHVNDQLGHQVGDDLLRLAARVVKANCRDIDTSARYGGDEFCILMPHTKTDEAIDVAHRIAIAFTEALEPRSDLDGLDVGMSIGLAHLDASRPVNAERLIRHADEALYAAKSWGKRQVALRVKDDVQSAPLPSRQRRL